MRPSRGREGGRRQEGVMGDREGVGGPSQTDGERRTPRTRQHAAVPTTSVKRQARKRQSLAQNAIR